MLRSSLILLSILFTSSLCHDDHSHSHAGVAVLPQVPVASTGHTHYHNGSAGIAAPVASNLHTHYVEPTASASGLDNLHTHYFNQGPAPVAPAPVIPAPAPQPQVVQDVLTLSLTPIRRPAPVVQAPPARTMKVRKRRKRKALYKDPPLPYLPGYKWNNYTQKREKYFFLIF